MPKRRQEKRLWPAPEEPTYVFRSMADAQGLRRSYIVSGSRRVGVVHVAVPSVSSFEWALLDKEQPAKPLGSLRFDVCGAVVTVERTAYSIYGTYERWEDFEEAASLLGPPPSSAGLLLPTCHTYVSLKVGHKTGRFEVNGLGHVRLQVGTLPNGRAQFMGGVCLPKRALRRLRKLVGHPVTTDWPEFAGWPI